MLYRTDNELTDAKEKLSKADSSSSDSEDETAPKRKKPVTIVDKPTEEVKRNSNKRSNLFIN